MLLPIQFSYLLLECKSTASVDVNTVILSIDYCSNGEKTVVNNALVSLFMNDLYSGHFQNPRAYWLWQ